MNKHLDVEETIKTSWELAKKNLGMAILMMFALYCVSVVLSMLALPSGYLGAVFSGDVSKLESLEGQANISSVFASIISGVIGLGMYNCFLEVARGKQERLSFEGFKMPAMTYLKLLGVQILVCIIVFVGFVLLVFPGIYLVCRLGMSAYCLMEDEDLGVVDAIKMSWKITEDNVLSIFLLYFMCGLILVLGLMCCCVGAVVAMPVVYFAGVVAYVSLNPEGNNLEESPLANYDKSLEL